MPSPKRSREKINELKQKHFQQLVPADLDFTVRLARLEAERAAVPEDEIDDWLLERTDDECRMLADPEQFFPGYRVFRGPEDTIVLLRKDKMKNLRQLVIEIPAEVR